MRRPRFRIRTLMITVAVVALVSGGVVEIDALRKRAAAYRAQTLSHADMETVWQSIIKANGAGSPVDVY